MSTYDRQLNRAALVAIWVCIAGMSVAAIGMVAELVNGCL